MNPIPNRWVHTALDSGMKTVYAVLPHEKAIAGCLVMTTDPGDLVFDPTCVRRGTRVWVCRSSSDGF